MTKKIFILIFTALLIGSLECSAQMTDNAILSYISQGMAAGKSENQIGAELVAKGVSKNQLERLVKAYKSGNVDISSMQGVTNKLDSRKQDLKSSRKRGSDIKSSVKLDPRTGLKMDDSLDFRKDSLDKLHLPEDMKKEVRKIYGHDVFRNRKLTFEPNENAATPEDYVLGPGDEVVIDIWGAAEASIREEISPEGRIFISQVGSFQLSGLTVKQAAEKIKNAMLSRYSGIEGNSAQISVTLGELRTIRVNVLGDVVSPGTYRLSSFSTVYNALYWAGGVTPTGSLRSVKVVRAGKQIATVDLYGFLFEGRNSKDVSLRDGDAIIVPAYSTLVKIEGGVKRPMWYELTPEESLSQLINYAGGLTGDAYSGDFSVVRKDGVQNHIFTVSAKQSPSFKLNDGDVVNIAVSSAETFSNQVEIRGAVYRPGQFELGGEIATVRQLVQHSGGMVDGAFGARAQILREKEDRTMEMVAVPIGAIMQGSAPDILLRKNDILIIAMTNEIETKGDFSISGYVVNPGNYEYADNTTVEDLILLAGGLEEGASTVRVDVSRRINRPDSMAASDTLAVVFSFGIKDGFVQDGTPDFYLQPYDIVAVRKSPSYIEQKVVTITGEVTFPGEYVLVSNNERISDLITRAGGPTPHGNIAGGMLRRKINQYERNARMTISQIVRNGGDGKDSLDLRKVKIPEVFSVGVEFDKAVANPGSDYDLVLRDGDEIIIPEIASTVRVQGEVLFPNTVQFISGRPVSYYISQSGGYSTVARRSKVYVVSMNGTVSVGLNSKVDAGCEIVVPRKPERDKMTVGEWLGIGTTAASLTTMIATIVNLIKK